MCSSIHMVITSQMGRAPPPPVPLLTGLDLHVHGTVTARERGGWSEAPDPLSLTGQAKNTLGFPEQKRTSDKTGQLKWCIYTLPRGTLKR